MDIEEMVMAILAKSGLICFSRAVRIIKDALVLSGNSHLLDKNVILSHMLKHSAVQIAESQTFVVESNLAFPDSKRM